PFSKKLSRSTRRTASPFCSSSKTPTSRWKFPATPTCSRPGASSSTDRARTCATIPSSRPPTSAGDRNGSRPVQAGGKARASKTYSRFFCHSERRESTEAEGRQSAIHRDNFGPTRPGYFAALRMTVELQHHQTGLLAVGDRDKPQG